MIAFPFKQLPSDESTVGINRFCTIQKTVSDRLSQTRDEEKVREKLITLHERFLTHVTATHKEKLQTSVIY
jgi:hypothetical protein